MSTDAQISTLNAEVLTLRHLVYAMLALYKSNELVAIRGHLARLSQHFDQLPQEAVLKFADTLADVEAVLSTTKPYGDAVNDVISTIDILIENANEH